MPLESNLRSKPGGTLLRQLEKKYLSKEEVDSSINLVSKVHNIVYKMLQIILSI